MKMKKQQQPAMRTLEFCILSAQDLGGVSKFGKMRAYAVASITPNHKVCTRIDADGGRNPTWDAKLVLQVDERMLQDEALNHTQLTINIFNRGRIRDKLVGIVRILVCDSIREDDDRRRSINRFPVTTYLVFRPGGDPQGILNVCIPPSGRFPDRFDSISFKHDELNPLLLSKQDSNFSTEFTNTTTDSSAVSEITEDEEICS